MRLVTLGGLRLEGSDLTRPKPLLLLCYLTIEGSRSRRGLADLFYADVKDPRDSLSTAYRHLKGLGEDAVSADGSHLTAGIACDAVDLISHLEADRIDQVVDLYRGSFLQGLDLELGAELEEWVFATREYLGSCFRRALLLQGETAAARGEFDRAARLAERAFHLPEAPLGSPGEIERAYAMLIAGRSPRATELREQAAQYGLELYTTPEEARVTFSGAPADAAPAPPNNLVHPGTSFVGRDREIGELVGHLMEGDHRLVTLLGAAGVGKTRLARRIAHEALDRGWFGDGAYFVRLEALADPSLIPMQIADAIGLRLGGTVDALLQVQREIGRKRMLLVLDNYEHLIEGASVAAELLEACPELRLLVTSRERLSVAAEAVYPIDGLAVPNHDGALEQADLGEAAQLFLERAKSADLHYVPTPESLPGVFEVCRLVDGYPLGIELAAAWVRLMQPEEIADEIARNLDFLSTTVWDVPDRHRSMRAAFESSWILLSRAERAVLRRLSVFRGGFQRTAASEVARASIPALASLVDKSLVGVSPDGRYALHPLLVQFAHEKLADHPDEAEAVRDAHGRYFAQFLERWGEQLRGPESGLATLHIEREHANIRAAWSWALQRRDMESLERLASLLSYFYEQRNRFREGAELYAKTTAELSAGAQSGHSAVGYLLVEEAMLRSRFGEEDESRELARRGIEVLRAHGETRGVMRGLVALVLLEWFEGSYANALAYCEEAVSLARQKHQTAELAVCLRLMGFVEFSAGNYRAAVDYAEEALRIHRDLDDAMGVSLTLHPLGLAMLETGRVTEAEEHFRMALDFARESGATETEAWSLGHLGRALLAKGELAEAEACLVERLRLTESHENPYLDAWTRVDLGRILIAAGKHAEAERHLLKGIEIAEGLRSVLPMLAALGSMADLRAQHGRNEEAIVLTSRVAGDPRCEHYVKLMAQRLLVGLRERVGEDVFSRAEARGTSSSLDALADEVLSGGRD